MKLAYFMTVDHLWNDLQYVEQQC